MRHTLCVALIGFSVSAAPQQPAPPATPKEAPIQSPEVLSDRRVIFRLRAPLAHDVSVAGDFWLQQNRTEKLTEDEHGIWSLTTGALTPDYYSYVFTVDGVHLPDPANGGVKPGVLETQSTFLVPGPEAEIVQPGRVPHGEIRMVFYTAAALGSVRRMHIYVPPGYNGGKAKYPTMYLFHGSGDDDGAWESIGRINAVLDNLIAQGKAKPMIVVMPSLWAIDPSLPGSRTEANEELFRKTLGGDVIPYVEANYRVMPGRDHRAAGGLGLGRAFLPNFVWPELDQFGTFLFVSGGADESHFSGLQSRYPGVLEQASNVHRVKFFMGDGTHDASFASAKYMSDELRRRGYAVQFVESQNTHGWPGFRYVFEQFATWAFK